MRMWRSTGRVSWLKLLLVLLVVMMVMMTASSCTTTTTRTFRRSIRMWRRMTTVRRWTVSGRNAGRRTRRWDEGTRFVSSLVMRPGNSLACNMLSNHAVCWFKMPSPLNSIERSNLYLVWGQHFRCCFRKTRSWLCEHLDGLTKRLCYYCRVRSYPTMSWQKHWLQVVA